MMVHVPDGVVGFLTALMGAGTTVLWAIKDKRIPLDWRSRKMEAKGGEYLTGEQFDNKLHTHCAKRQAELNVMLKDISGVLMDIRERLSRLEGAFQADHK